MAGLKMSIFYLGVAVGIGFGIGRVTFHSKENKKNSLAVETKAKKNNAKKKRKNSASPSSKADETWAQSSATQSNVASAESATPSHEDNSASVPADQNPNNTGTPPRSASFPTDGISRALTDIQQHKSQPEKPATTSEKSQVSPKVRLFNAYRTRTFWTPGSINTDSQTFAIFIEKEESTDPSLKPRVDWQVGSAQGTVWGDPRKKTQMISLPEEAWRLDQPAVEVRIKVGSAREGEDFVGSTESATLTIKSLSAVLNKNGGMIYISAKPRAANNGPGWLTSWNKILPGKGITTVYVAPGVSPESLWPLLSSAEDFRVEPGVTPTQPMELFASRERILFGVVSGQIVGTQRSLLLRNSQIVLTYRGLPQDYLGSLQGDPQALTEKVKANAIGDTVVLYRANSPQPFGGVKKALITVPNISLLRKEGQALFTKPVEGATYLVH